MPMTPDAFAGNIPIADEGLGFALGMVLLVVMVVCFLSIGISILFYILHSLGLYGIAKRRQIRNEWLAWIPLGNLWILGSISDQYRYVTRGQVKNRRKLLLGLGIALTVLSGLGGVISFVVSFILGMSAGDVTSTVGTILLAVGVVWVLAMVQLVFEYITYYDLYRSCNPDKADLFLVLSILFPVTLPFFVFAMRNKDMGMPPRKQAPTPEPISVPEVVAEVVEEEPAEAVVEAEESFPQQEEQ